MKRICLACLLLVAISASSWGDESEPQKKLRAHIEFINLGLTLAKGQHAAYKELVSFGPSVLLSVKESRFYLGGGCYIGLTFNRLASPQHNYRCPHDNFSILGESDSGFSLTPAFAAGYRLPLSEKVSIMLAGEVGLTFAFITHGVVAKSNVTGFTYDHGDGSDQKTHFLPEFAAKISLRLGGFAITGGYSYTRGMLLGFCL